ncbi:hypothetical protein F7725_025042 [Dissostichus mawsoni]|uniref:Uncharacterized protein n=1 Tax=Dissostichus mawsoni TaxID=36200 RepID=A0A7J5XBX0_DISMA|nr:hypothetical protein F7725_025042 [Dissostichus mawsoni]
MWLIIKCPHHAGLHAPDYSHVSTGGPTDGVMGRRRGEQGAYTASLGQGVATVSGKCPLAGLFQLVVTRILYDGLKPRLQDWYFSFSWGERFSIFSLSVFCLRSVYLKDFDLAGGRVEVLYVLSPLSLGERVKLDPEGDAFLSPVLSGSELCADAVHLQHKHVIDVEI